MGVFMNKLLFPENFTWGAAAASYQIEGAVREDGRGESIWDRYTHIRDGRVKDCADGDVACDFYHRYPEDIGLAKELGVQSLRLSVAWPRVFPDGKGKPNQKGIDFYRRVVECLLENGIEPCVTLFHWDLPQALQDLGGWCNRDSAGWFSDYASAVYNAIGKETGVWITMNETYIFTMAGYVGGRHAPGLRDFSASLLAGHNLMRAHGAAVQAFRAMNLPGKIGIANNFSPAYPHAATQSDILAAKRQDGYHNRWFTDPLFHKGYPQDMQEWFAASGVCLPKVHEGDLELIAQPVDFLGVNFYNPEYVAHSEESWPMKCAAKKTGRPLTDCDWEIEPDSLYDLLTGLHRDYGAPAIKITENGSAWRDLVNRHGNVEDDNRIEYMHRHLAACHRAIAGGVPLDAYYVWALTDNFEWAHATSKRFGLIHLDYETQKRTVKASGRWYGEVIKRGGLEPA